MAEAAAHPARKPPPKSKPLNAAQILTEKQPEEWRTSLLGVTEILDAGRQRPRFLVTRPADQERRALGLIPEASYTLLAADSGHGKTWVALDLARLLAWPPAGDEPQKRWLDVYDVDPCGVLYLDRENGAGLIGRRLAGLGLLAGARLKLWPQRSDERSKLKLDEAGTDQILACCECYELKVVILDSLVRFHSADENDASDMGEVAVQIQRLKSAGLAVIALHHNRKGGGSPADRMRGSGEIMAAADTVLHLEKWRDDPNRFTLSASKLRHVGESNFCRHWFERRELEEDKFEFARGGDLPDRDENSGPGKAKTRGKRRMSSESMEEKAKRAMPEVLKVYQEMVAARDKMDQASIARRCGKKNQVVGKALAMLREEGTI